MLNNYKVLPKIMNKNYTFNKLSIMLHNKYLQI